MTSADDIRQACRTLLAEYTAAVDSGDAALMLSLFTKDGVLRRGDLVLNGHAEIPRILEGRAPGTVMRHLLTTVVIRPSDDGRDAAGLSYYLLYNGRGEQLPLTFEQPFSLGDWHSRFVLTDAGWKLSYQEIKRVFMRPPAPTT